jgi:hypothetical protein
LYSSLASQAALTLATASSKFTTSIDKILKLARRCHLEKERVIDQKGRRIT